MCSPAHSCQNIIFVSHLLKSHSSQAASQHSTMRRPNATFTPLRASDLSNSTGTLSPKSPVTFERHRFKSSGKRRTISTPGPQPSISVSPKFDTHFPVDSPSPWYASLTSRFYAPNAKSSTGSGCATVATRAGLWAYHDAASTTVTTFAAARPSTMLLGKQRGDTKHAVANLTTSGGKDWGPGAIRSPSITAV